MIGLASFTLAAQGIPFPLRPAKKLSLSWIVLN
jgi:hypothetical protein